MSCIVQIHIVTSKQGLSQKVFKLLHASLCFWLTVVTDQALQVFAYFLQFYCSTITGDVCVSRTVSGRQFALLC